MGRRRGPERMNERNERERVAELLRRARRREERGAAESLEDTLRWLLKVSMPERAASQGLRERVRSLLAPPPPGCGTALARLLTRLRPHRRASHRESQREAPRRPPALTPPEREWLALLLAADVRRLPPDPALHQTARRLAPRLLALLPEAEREVLLLRLGEGLSAAETARVIGRTEAETRALLQQAHDSISQQAAGERGC